MKGLLLFLSLIFFLLIITQRDTDFHDTRESIVLARNWLQSKALTVNQFNSELKKHKDGVHSTGKWGTDSQPDSYRSIADFLSKNSYR